MEKCKKLSLKSRKTLSLKDSSLKEPNKRNVNRSTDPVVSEIIAVNEDEVFDREAAVAEQRQQQLTAIDNKRKVAESSDPNLNKLRNLIMSVSANRREKGIPLLPFPSYKDDNTNITSNQEGRLLGTACFSYTRDGLSPFPSIPARYVQRKKLRKDNHKEQNGNETEAKRYNHGEDTNITRRITDSDKNNTCTTNSVPSVPNQNCHLIRDRNSNFYSLQTRNQTPSQNHINRDNMNIHDQSTSNISARLTSNICSSTSSALNNHNLSTNAQNGQNKSHQRSIPSAECDWNNTRQRPPISSTSSAFNNKHTSTISAQNGRNITPERPTTSAQNRQTNIGAHTSNSNINTSTNNLPAGTNLGTKQALKYTKPDDAKDPGPRLEDSALKRKAPDLLIHCPLCQLEFPEQSTQMDIDSHIAQCLTNSEDDVMW